MAIVNLLEAFGAVSDYWAPRVVARVNDQYVKVAKIKGELTWHKHDDEDELFYVVKGRMAIEYEDGIVHLNEGDTHVVPKGTMHNPVAEAECWIALIEPVTTKHTGDVIMEKTRSIEEQLSDRKG